MSYSTLHSYILSLECFEELKKSSTVEVSIGTIMCYSQQKLLMCLSSSQERCKVDALSVKMHLLVTNLNLHKQTVSVLAHISTLFEPRGKSKSGSSIPTVQLCSSYCNRGGDITNKWLRDSEITEATLRNGNEETNIRMCRMGRVWSKEMNAAQGHTLAAVSG